MAESAVDIAVIVLTAIGIVANVTALVSKLLKDFSNPKLWKYFLLVLDVSHIIIGVGLVLFWSYYKTGIRSICEASGFFLLLGVFESVCAFLIAGIILLCIQNPGKSEQLSNFHRNVFLFIFTPQILISITLSCLPNIPMEIFDKVSPYTVDCFPIRNKSDHGSAYGALIVCLWWVVLVAATICCFISALKLLKFNNRINSSQPNVWQSQLVNQGKTTQKIILFQETIWICALLLTTIVVYADNTILKPETWIVMTTFSILTIANGAFSNFGNIMWGTCCCRSSQAVEEPRRKLKKLELIRIEVGIPIIKRKAI
ncbi:hypothetical protein ACJMK2_037542 [Sinanodonta woodiana]|uniref:Uncharacterized protein n=1 Tax=Sinanodonta woodiana TaxID=1069815 RepID=A0ABD3WKQ9_SINWO